MAPVFVRRAFALGVLLATVVPAIPAEAREATGCVVGKWRLVSVKGYYRSDDGDRIDRSGASGVRLTIGKKKAFFTFTGSKPLMFHGTFAATGPTSWKVVYRGKLQIGVSSTAKLLSFKDTSARGNATSTSDGDTTPLAGELRKGVREYLVPDGSRYTCTKQRLVTKVKLNMLGVRTGDTLTFRRIP
ncbi:hypothetical protein EDD29_5062 [Actinocorallia herbida]|uniref:Lipocalin-like protein n=1 Tax=Actinocorallia herbida TaxID=58109 RepID=A0A3N1D1P7_9ACTN|nr:hypothetical protein [Actinocorallia herbida]ROO87454.1 hypothetical protein EDD29_5062 [Actinocorallia herbida]